MKLLKVKNNTAVWSGDHQFKTNVGLCEKNDIMQYLNETLNFFDSENLDQKNYFFRVLHHKYGDCWLWTTNKNIKWLTSV